MFRKKRPITILTAIMLALFSLQLPAAPVSKEIQSVRPAAYTDMATEVGEGSFMVAGATTVSSPTLSAASLAGPETESAPQPLAYICIAADIVHSGAIATGETITIDLTYGEGFTSYYILENDVKISNPSNQTVRNLKLEVPLMAKIDSPYQEIIGEEFSLQPAKITEEANGNRIGFFAFDDIAPGQQVILVQKYMVKVDGTDWLEVAQDIDLENPQEYLQAGAKIESTAPQIVAVAKNIASQVGEEDDLAIAREAFEFARTALKYDKTSPSANQGALAGLQAGAGVCEEYASLFVATSRAAGVPARVVNGYASDVAELAQDPNPWFLEGRRHQWAEFYLDGKGWIPADPTLTNEENPMFGELPTGHYVAQNYGDEPLKGTYRGGKVAIGFEDKVAKKVKAEDDSKKH